MDIPRLPNAACITNNGQIAAEFSLRYSDPHLYIPVYETPLVTQYDQHNAALKVADSLVKSGIKTVYLGQVDDPVAEILRSALPPETEFEKIATSTSTPFDTRSLALRLLAARRAGTRTLPTSHKGSFVAGEDPHLVVLEEDSAISEVIASNYAWSLGASLQLIPKIGREESELICRRIFESDSTTDRSPTEAMELIKDELRSHCDLQSTDFDCITFITSRVPFGIAYPDVPSTHLFVYPQLGRAIVNAIAVESRLPIGIEIAVTVDPHEFGTELQGIAKTVHNRGAQALRISGKSATVNMVENTIEAFPYDLLAISTHAGEATGVRTKYTYDDSDGVEHELVVDEAITFGTTDVSADGSVLTRQFVYFVSLDGFAWTKKHDHLPPEVIEKAMNAFMNLPKGLERKKYMTILDSSRKVPCCMVLSMHDGYYTPMLHFVAGQSCPVVFNNACSSWQELSLWFTFAGARAYIGPLYPVIGAEAEVLGETLFGANVHRPLACALWRAQADAFPGDRKPYVMVGAHFCRLAEPRRNTRESLARRIDVEIHQWEAYASRADVASHLREKGRGYARFLERQKRALGL